MSLTITRLFYFVRRWRDNRKILRILVASNRGGEIKIYRDKHFQFVSLSELPAARSAELNVLNITYSSDLHRARLNEPDKK